MLVTQTLGFMSYTGFSKTYTLLNSIIVFYEILDELSLKHYNSKTFYNSPMFSKWSVGSKLGLKIVSRIQN